MRPWSPRIIADRRVPGRLAARPDPPDPVRLVVAPVVPGLLVVALDPVTVGRPRAGHPGVVGIGLRHPLVVPVTGLPAAPRRDEHGLGHDDDPPVAGAAEALLLLAVLLAEVLDVVEAPARTGEGAVGQDGGG